MKALLLPFAWIWITVPLGWGVYQSVNKSLPLFGIQPGGTKAPAAAAPAAPVR